MRKGFYQGSSDRSKSIAQHDCDEYALFQPESGRQGKGSPGAAVETTPNDAVANYLMADILFREGAEPGQSQFEEARTYLARSLAAKPDSAEAQTLMGTLCQLEDKLPEALGNV